MSISASNVIVSYLKIKKPVGWVFKAAGSNMNFNHITIDAKSDSSAFPFNVSSSPAHLGDEAAEPRSTYRRMASTSGA